MLEWLKKFLPKNIFFIIMYLIIIIILLFLIFNNFKKKEKFEMVHKIEKEYLKKESLKNLEKKDTDGDGLEDWQEHLYGTDIELVDTDMDGISDNEEILKGRDPLIFGVGNKQEIIKLNQVRSGVFGLKEQRDEFLKYKEKLKKEEAKRFELYLKSKSKGLTNEEKILLERNSQRKKIIKNDLNKLASIITRYEKQIDITKMNYFKVFFDALIDDKKKVTAEQLEYISKVADINFYLSEELKSISVVNKDVESYRKDFSNIYYSIADDLKKLLDIYKNKKDKEVENYIQKYGNDISRLVKVRQYINIFIEGNDIKFGSYESGKIFQYSL